MKLRTLLAAGLLIAALPAPGQTALDEPFDSDAGFTKYAGELSDLSDLDTTDVNTDPITFQSDGGSDYFGIYDPDTVAVDSNDFDGGATPTSDQLNLTGNTTPFLTFQDLDPDAPVPEDIRAVQWDNIDISTLTSLQYSIDLAEGDDGTSHDIDDLDFFLLQVRIDSNDPNDWTTVLAFYGNQSGTTTNGDWGIDASPMDGDADDPLGSGVELTDNWNTFSNSFAGTGSDIDVRVVVHVDGTDEDISIDNVKILQASASPPAISTLSPADNASDVPVAHDLSVTFDKLVTKGSGNIVLWRVSVPTDTIVQTFNVASDVDFSGATVTVNPTANLDTLSDYYVKIDSGAIEDTFGTPFDGISLNSTWNFTTEVEDLTPPSISLLSPPNNATGTGTTSNLVITFNEPITTALFGGNIVIKESPSGDTFETISVTSPNVTLPLFSPVMTIDPTNIFNEFTVYYVEIVSGAIEDLNNNPFGGISGDSTWKFTTGGALPELVINEIMQNPNAVADADGEWFEIYNPDTSPVDIDGWTIRDAGIDSHVINNGGPLEVPAEGYLVLGRNSDSMTNGGVTVAYQYSSFTLVNSADKIILEDTDNSEIDRVEYDGGPNFPDPTGASMALTDPALDNNVGSNWYTSTPAFGGGDKGTPGAENVEPDNAFAAWLGNNGYADTGFDEDLEGDGDTAGAEWYFFGTSPDAASNNGSPVSEVTSTGAGTFTFTHRRPTSRVGVTETYVYSFNLDGTWNPGDATVTITPGATVPDGPGYEIVTVTVTVDPPTTAQVFVRLEIAEETPM